MLLEALFDWPVKPLDRAGHVANLTGQGVGHQARRHDQGGVLGQRLGLSDGGHPLLDLLRSPVAVVAVALPDSASRAAGEGFSVGPPLQAIASAGRAQFAGPLQSLGEIALQQARQLRGQGRALSHSLAAPVHQPFEAAGGLSVRHPDAQMVPGLQPSVQQQPGLARVILGPAAVERLAVLRQGVGGDRGEPQEIDMPPGLD